MKVSTVASLLATRAAAGVMGFALGIYALSILVIPGPGYKFYLSPKFVDTDAAFEELKTVNSAGRWRQDL